MRACFKKLLFKIVLSEAGGALLCVCVCVCVSLAAFVNLSWKEFLEQPCCRNIWAGSVTKSGQIGLFQSIRCSQRMAYSVNCFGQKEEVAENKAFFILLR